MLLEILKIILVIISVLIIERALLKIVKFLFEINLTLKNFLGSLSTNSNGVMYSIQDLSKSINNKFKYNSSESHNYIVYKNNEAFKIVKIKHDRLLNEKEKENIKNQFGDVKNIILKHLETIDLTSIVLKSG